MGELALRDEGLDGVVLKVLALGMGLEFATPDGHRGVGDWCSNGARPVPRTEFACAAVPTRDRHLRSERGPASPGLSAVPSRRGICDPNPAGPVSPTELADAAVPTRDSNCGPNAARPVPHVSAVPA